MLAAAWASAVPGCGGESSPSRIPERPGIVLVIGDDVGFGDYGFMGSPVARTPHLDALAAQGVVFTRAFTTASVCRPSLQTLLTGLQPYAVEARLARERRAGRSPTFAESFETLPELLGRQGYVSFAGGKFWEGSPLDAGFTHTMSDWPAWREQQEALPITLAMAGGYSLALGRATLAPLFEFLEQHASAPFFVWYAPMLPHLPFDAPARYVELYRDAGLPPYAKAYFANLTRLDDSVGELMAFLERQGLRERTAVVYLADNGWDSSVEPTSYETLGLGGEAGKGSLHEPGFRTPLVLSWPGVLPEGLRNERLVSTEDVFSTLLDLAGATPPRSRSARSLLPLLRGGPANRRPYVVGGATTLRPDGKAPPLGPREQGWYLRTPQWRYVYAGAAGGESLYRIEEDPHETSNLAAQYPDVLRELRMDLFAEISAIGRAAAADSRGR